MPDDDQDVVKIDFDDPTWKAAVAADRAEQEADRQLAEIFGANCTLNEMFALDDLWANLTGFQRQKILIAATANDTVSYCKAGIRLCELHTHRPQITIAQAKEVVRILREEDLERYR